MILHLQTILGLIRGDAYGGYATSARMVFCWEMLIPVVHTLGTIVRGQYGFKMAHTTTILVTFEPRCHT